MKTHEETSTANMASSAVPFKKAVFKRRRDCDVALAFLRANGKRGDDYDFNESSELLISKGAITKIKEKYPDCSVCEGESCEISKKDTTKMKNQESIKEANLSKRVEFRKTSDAEAVIRWLKRYVGSSEYAIVKRINMAPVLKVTDEVSTAIAKEFPDSIHDTLKEAKDEKGGDKNDNEKTGDDGVDNTVMRLRQMGEMSDEMAEAILDEESVDSEAYKAVSDAYDTLDALYALIEKKYDIDSSDAYSLDIDDDDEVMKDLDEALGIMNLEDAVVAAGKAGFMRVRSMVTTNEKSQIEKELKIKYATGGRYRWGANGSILVVCEAESGQVYYVLFAGDRSTISVAVEADADSIDVIKEYASANIVEDEKTIDEDRGDYDNPVVTFDSNVFAQFLKGSGFTRLRGRHAAGIISALNILSVTEADAPYKFGCVLRDPKSGVSAGCAIGSSGDEVFFATSRHGIVSFTSDNPFAIQGHLIQNAGLNESLVESYDITTINLPNILTQLGYEGFEKVNVEEIKKKFIKRAKFLADCVWGIPTRSGKWGDIFVGVNSSGFAVEKNGEVKRTAKIAGLSGILNEIGI